MVLLGVGLTYLCLPFFGLKDMIGKRSLKRYGPDFDYVVFDDPIDVTPKEPWREHRLADRVILVPCGVLRLFADPARISLLLHQEHEKVRLDQVGASIAATGLTDPCTVFYDDYGKVRFHDGYHRLIVSDRIDWLNVLPTVLEHSDRITGYGRPIEEFLETVLWAGFKERSVHKKIFEANWSRAAVMLSVHRAGV